MITTTGIIVLVASLIAWLGQTTVLLAPNTGVRLGLLEPPDEIDPVLRLIESKAEAVMDALLGWTLPAAALLMMLGHPFWPFLGLVGAGVYLYLSGLIMLSRHFLRKHGRSVGRPASERGAYVFGTIWAVSALAMLALSVVELMSQVQSD